MYVNLRLLSFLQLSRWFFVGILGLTELVFTCVRICKSIFVSTVCEGIGSCDSSSFSELRSVESVRLDSIDWKVDLFPWNCVPTLDELGFTI